AEWFKRSGHLPLWNPEIFGGLPFVAAGSGDIFYPTWLLRYVLPVTTAGNVSFFAHYILAGLFTYLLLRRLQVGWTGSVVAGLALVAVLIGFGVAAVHVVPFFEYIPYSPRAQGYHGFEGSTSFAIPWDHVPEFFLKNFVGRSWDTYWGSNQLKFHSEYLGLP